MIAYSFPEYFVITGSVVSIDVAPADAIGAILPKILTKRGVAMSVNISLEILAMSARTPRVSFLIFDIRILDRL
jgi:hypothetical protein